MRIHQPRVTLSYLQNPRNRKVLTFILTYVKSTTSLITPRIPLKLIFTSTMKTAALFQLLKTRKLYQGQYQEKALGRRPQRHKRSLLI